MKHFEYLGRIEYRGEALSLYRTSYESDPGVPALLLLVEETGEPYCTLTVNLRKSTKKGEYTIKTWSENENIYNFLVNEEILSPTGVMIPTGFCKAAVCKLDIRKLSI